jgi:hypothetical protein
MDTQEVKDYLAKLPDDSIALYSSLPTQQQDKQIFLAAELLGDFYRSKDITARAVALQMLYNLEAEGEEFARLKRHGIQSMSTKDTSVTFARADALSPSVISILGEPISKAKGFTGRLI